MNDRELEQMLNAAVSSATPDVLDSIHSDLHDQKGNVLIMKTNTAASSLRRAGAGIAAAFLLGAVSLFGYAQYHLHHAVASTVALDVNPSIEIRLSKKEDVLDVIAKNEDGKIVIGDMDFRGSDLDVTVNALIGSMLREGYLNDLSNSILISVVSDDAERSVALQTKLSEKVHSLLQTDTFDGSVVSQTTTADPELQSASEQYGITVGKAALIREITNNSHHTMEELAGLSVNELNLLLSSSAANPKGVSTSGSASEKSYIGRDAALSTAFAHAGTTASASWDIECELDWDDGKMIYEVEFSSGKFEFEYDIHATTGQILSVEKDPFDDFDDWYDDDNEVPHISFDRVIDGNTALTHALAHAGLSRSDISDLGIELDEDDDRLVYEIDFDANRYEYEYDIDAITGAVLQCEKDTDDDWYDGDDDDDIPVSSSSLIDGNTALTHALAHAGLSHIDIYDLDIELDEDDDRLVYEIKFTANGYEFEYDIDPYTGTVLQCEKDTDDDWYYDDDDDDDDDDDIPVSSSSLIDENTALTHALTHAGLSRSDIYDLDIELDEDDDRLVYEIEFTANGYEFKYDVNAVTGAILQSEKEQD